jgi:hypothetical protein
MALALTTSGAVAQGVPEIDVTALVQMQSINAGEQAQMAEQAQISADRRP